MRDEVQPRLKELVTALHKSVPAGVGSEGAIQEPGMPEFEKAVTRGARWAIDQGFGSEADLPHIEEFGCLEGADLKAVPKKAIERGKPQMGTLGSGNHFLEVQVVDRVLMPHIAEHMGLLEGTVCVSIHSGSRGFGHEICDSSIGVMLKAAEKYGIPLPDRQLCCAPLSSPEAKQYLAAMKCAANFAWNNRQIMRGITERVFKKIFGEEVIVQTLYDVCHNIAKIEEHVVDGQKKKVCVHRKGATRALGPGHPLVPPAYRDIGQPVMIPGDMGRSSFLLIGTQTAESETFGSSCHGAGRVQSRKAMVKSMQGRNLYKELEEKHGVIVMAHGFASVAEEMPDAYKDAQVVVDVVQAAGISRPVVGLKPIGCVKG